MSPHETAARHAAPVRPRASTAELTVDPIEHTVDEASDQTTPRRWTAITNQWATVRRDLRAGARMVRHTPGHAVEDPHAERVAAAGMGLLVLLGAIVTYVAVVGGIDPWLSPSPAGGAPAVVVPSVTPTPTPTSTADPTDATSAPEVGPMSGTTLNRPLSRTTTSQPVTPTANVPEPAPTPTPTPSGPAPTPSPSPSR